MPQITDSQLNEMLDNMPPALAAQYRSALTGDTAYVYCLSKTCKGRKIGAQNATGQWQNVSKAKSGRLLSTRVRFDGHIGFRCRCGNSSITSPAETGVISGAAPTRSQLAKIYQAQLDQPAAVTENKDGTVTIDGFKIETIRSTT